jgi:hypothetical protein
MEEEQTPEPTQKRRFPQKNTKYEKPEVENRVIVLRDKGESWQSIAETMKSEIDEPKFSQAMAQKIYNRAMAKTITTEKRAGKKFADYTEELGNMYGKAVRVLDRWINAADKLSEELERAVDDGDIGAIKAYGILLKTAPQMKAISSEIRDYMRFQQDQQEKITVEQKALVWDESQMLDYMDQYLDKLEKEGKIRWIKPKND